MNRRRTPGTDASDARGPGAVGPVAVGPGAVGPGAAGPAERFPGAPVSVVVRVRPGAGRTRAGGRYDGPHGPALVVAVGAPAVDGRATEAVRRVLADALGVRAVAVSLRLGATSRDKVFAVDADPRLVAARLAELRDGPTTGPDAARGTGDRGAGRRLGGSDAARRPGDRGGA